MKSVLLINVKLGHEDEVRVRLSCIDNVVKTSRVYGAYDLIAEIESDGVESMQETVTKIRKIHEIRSTMTLMVINE